ncbi:MAG: M50 family metallopeptidase [Deltaproteobacteria bacterium]
MSYVFAILAVGLLIALHELGHLVVARLVGMRVERYSIGFGPVVARLRRGDTEYCLSALPIGGYVKIAGMNPAEESAPDDPRAYNHRPAWQRLLVIAAGPLTNELLAVTLVYAVAIAGMPYTKRAIVGEILPGSAAAQAGLRPGDEVTSVDGAPIQSFDDLVSAIQAHPQEAVALELMRGGEPVRAIARLGAPPILGVAAPIRRYAPLEAIPAAFGWTGRQTVGMVAGLVSAVRHPRGARLSGPIGTVQVTVDEAKHGWQSLVFTLALISLALAVFNVLPWPALDGGRLLFLLYELVFRRPVNQRVETAVHAVGFLALIGLIVLVTVGDIRKLVSGSRGGADSQSDAGP